MEVKLPENRFILLPNGEEASIIEGVRDLFWRVRLERNGEMIWVKVADLAPQEEGHSGAV